jgi:thiamine-phosphate pyrophosphorylase
VLRCAITDRSLFPGDESQKRSALAVQAARWAAQGIDLIQLREKDLGPLELADIAHAMLEAIHAATRSASPPMSSESGTEVSSRPERSGVERPALLPPSSSRLLINGSLRAAIESHAHGVHLPSNSSILPDEARRRYAVHSLPRPIVTISCHTLAEIHIAQRNRADAILFAPVFGKTIDGSPITPAAGLEALQAACEVAAPIPIYALGGVTQENAPLCLEAGAAGIAGIRLFHTSLE